MKKKSFDLQNDNINIQYLRIYSISKERESYHLRKYQFPRIDSKQYSRETEVVNKSKLVHWQYLFENV